MFQNKNAVSNHQTVHIYANMSCWFVLLMMNNEYFVWFVVFKSHVNSYFSQESFDGIFFSYYLSIKPVIVLCNGYILLFLSATLWQRGNLHIHLYSQFTQNSCVVNVNWHINKKKFDTNNCQEA